jgi:hypothetical protein
VVLLSCIRDRTWRRATRTVWCPTHQRAAAIDVSERVSTGMMIRDLKRCSLIETGARCHRECLNEIA